MRTAGRDRRWSQRFAGRQGSAARGRGRGAPARAAFDLFARRGLPHRRVEEFEVHRPARPDARGGAARREAVGRGSRRGALGRRAPSPTSTSAALAVRQRPFRRASASDHDAAGGASRSSRSPRRSPPDIRSLAEIERRSSRGRATTPPIQLNTAFMSRRRGDPRRRRRRVARPLHLRFVTSAPAAVATATRVLVVVEEGASRDACRIARRRRTARRISQTTSSRSSPATGANVRHVRLNAEGRGRSRCRR